MHEAQQAVNIVAAVMAGQPRAEIERELRHWLDRRGVALPEPHYSLVVEAVALGCRAVTLDPSPDAVCRRHCEAPEMPGDTRGEYVFLDGPLAGQVLSVTDVHADGDRIEVGVVDVLDSADTPSFVYRVNSSARHPDPGTLRHVRSRSRRHRTSQPS